MSKVTPAAPDPTTSLAALGAAIAALEDLSDIEQAQRAGELYEQARRMLPQTRRAAIFRASRGYGGGKLVAQILGVTPSAINQAIAYHKADVA